MDRCTLVAYYIDFSSVFFSVFIYVILLFFFDKYVDKIWVKILFVVFNAILICIFYPLYSNDIEKYNLTYWAFAQRCLLSSLIPIGFGLFIIYKQKKMIESENSG